MNNHIDSALSFTEETKSESSAPEWGEIASAPNSGRRARETPSQPVNVLGALEWGLVGGAVIGVAWAFLAKPAFWPTVFGAALAGAVLWATLAATVAALAGKRSADAALATGLLQFVRAGAVLVYVAAVLVIFGFIVHTKVKLNSPPRTPPPAVQPATIN